MSVYTYARVCVCAPRNCGGDDDTRVVHDEEEERMSMEPVAPEEVQAVLSTPRLILVAGENAYKIRASRIYNMKKKD